MDFYTAETASAYDLLARSLAFVPVSFPLRNDAVFIHPYIQKAFRATAITVNAHISPPNPVMSIIFIVDVAKRPSGKPYAHTLSGYMDG